MNMTLFACVICFFFLVISLAEALHGSKSPITKTAGGMLAGAGVLLGANLLEPLTGIHVAFSALNLSCSLVGGVPGALLAVFLSAILL